MSNTHESTYFTLPVSGGVSAEFDFKNFTQGMVEVPSGWVTANIGFSAAEKSGGTFSLMRDNAGAVVGISGISTSLKRWYNFPAAVLSPRYMKLNSLNTSGNETVVNQTNVTTLKVVLKS